MEIIKFITDIKGLIMQLLLWIIYKVIKVGGISKVIRLALDYFKQAILSLYQCLYLFEIFI